MNSRERILAIFLVFVILVVGGGVFGYRLFYVPWDEKTRTLARLDKEHDEKLLRAAEIQREKKKLDVWRHLSLPAEPTVARREYGKYLTELLSRSGIAAGKFSVTAPPVDAKSSPTLPGNKKETIYTKLTFNVQCFATLQVLVRALEDFYRTGVMHQIKSLTMQRQMTTTGQARADELDVRLTVEALIVTGTESRSWLLPNISRALVAADVMSGLTGRPTGLGLALWAAGPSGPSHLDHGPLRARQEGALRALDPKASTTTSVDVVYDTPREYDAMTSKNVFLGRPPREARDEGSPRWMAPRFVYLVDISTDERGRLTTFLYDRATGKNHKLQARYGYGSFPFIKDNAPKNVLEGALVKIDEESRDVVFRVRLNAAEARSESDPGFYVPDKEERRALLAEKAIAAGEEELVYRVDKAYWELLERHKVIRVNERDGSFRFMLERELDRPSDDLESAPLEVTRGRVLKREGGELLIKIEERYYGLHLGQNLEEGLRKSLPESEVKQLRVAAND